MSGENQCSPLTLSCALSAVYLNLFLVPPCLICLQVVPLFFFTSCFVLRARAVPFYVPSMYCIMQESSAVRALLDQSALRLETMGRQLRGLVAGQVGQTA